MKLTHLFRFVIILVFLELCSCTFIFNDKSNFTLFKEPVIKNFDGIPLKTNGIYISEDGGAAFYLYKNGQVKILKPFFRQESKEFWIDPLDIINSVKLNWEFDSKEYWGNFLINEDEIVLQNFNRNNIFRERYLFEKRGRILNDSTIVIFSNYIYNTGDSLLKTECLLKFYPTIIKPDSTNIWFVNKKWYRKNLHESRK
jgi:hypothetical protein